MLQRTIHFEGCCGQARVILLGTPNNVFVWGITILPFEKLVSGVLVVDNQLRLAFSTFKARDV